MATRLSSAQRSALKERVSAARHARAVARPRHMGLAERCYDAARGDSYLALELAVEMTRRRVSADPETKPPRARVSYEEMFA
jgi:hypothetical protein